MNSAIVLGMTGLIYLLINFGLSYVPLPALVTSYVIQPVLWVGLAWSVTRLPSVRPAAKYSVRPSILQLALLTGFFQVFLYAIGGLFSGFGKSPSSFTPLGIVTNIVFVGATLLGTELSRAWLINRAGKKHPMAAVTVFALLYTLIAIPPGQIAGFTLNIEALNIIGSSWLPLLAENLLASMFAYLAGARAPIAYRGMLALFWWFCPIIPDLTWAFKGLIGAVVPVGGMVVLNNLYPAVDSRKKNRRAKNDSFPAGWILTSIVSIVAIWFAVGLFPFKPALIPTGSMIPICYPGDIVIIAKVPVNMIKLGDIIEYRDAKQNINIVHRVTEIVKTGEASYFITKGDNNNAADAEPVSPQAVMGKLVLTVPKIGWISIFIKSFFTTQN